MSDNSSEILKQKGNEQLKNKNYDKAIRFYNEAIEYDQYNPKLYSNRCTARLLLNDYENALEDAKKCVSLDPDWSKGYIQKGSCYASMQKYQEALSEYNKALEKADDKPHVEKLIKDLKSKIEKNSISHQFFGDSTKTLLSIENILRLLLLFSFIISFLPFPVSLRLRFSRVLNVSIFCIVLIHTYRLHGRPRWSLQYWTPILRDTLVCYLFPLLLFSSTQFKFIPILMILLHEAPALCKALYALCALKAPALADKMVNALNSAMVKVSQDTTWYSRTPAEKEYLVNEVVGLACASFEVSLVVPAVLSLFKGLKGLYSVLMMIQYLVYRNGIDMHVQRTIASYDVAINRMMYSPKCPGFLRTIYGKIRGFLVNLSGNMFRRQ